MPLKTLPNQEFERLESERSRLKNEIDQLPDMRPGSMTIAHPKCGKSNCHCAREGDPRHGPVHFLIRWVNNKTVTRSIPIEDLDTVRHQVETHRKYEDLSRQFVEISGQISDLKLQESKRNASEPVKKNSRNRSRPGGVDGT